MGVILEAEMENREKISFTVEEKTFEFYAEATAIESRRIRNEMAELIGGLDNLLSLEQLISKEYSAQYEKAKENSNEEEAMNVMASGTNYTKLLKAFSEKKNLYDLAFIKVMCVKPFGFNCYAQKEDYLKKIANELNAKLDEVKKKSATSAT